MHLFISTHRITPTPSLSCVTVPVPGRPGAGAQLSKSQEQMRLGEFSFLFPFFSSKKPMEKGHMYLPTYPLLNLALRARLANSHDFILFIP